MKDGLTYSKVFFKFIYIFAAYTLILVPQSFAGDYLLEKDDLRKQKRRYLSRLAIPQSTEETYKKVLPKLKPCHEIIQAYIGKVTGQYKLKKMVINETDIGTFVVPSNSFITYMMIMTPSNFDRIYLPKYRDRKFNCTMEGEPFKGVYHLY